jgi:hypothetical protein
MVQLDENLKHSRQNENEQKNMALDTGYACVTFHGGTAGASVGPNDQRRVGVGILSAKEPVEEVVWCRRDIDVPRVHVKIDLSAADDRIRKCHLALGNRSAGDRGGI